MCAEISQKISLEQQKNFVAARLYVHLTDPCILRSEKKVTKRRLKGDLSRNFLEHSPTFSQKISLCESA